MDFEGPFQIPLWFDYGATFIWALTGALIAARRGYDIAGIATLALVSATGGGLLRDGIFLQNEPPLFLRTWVYMALVAVAASAVHLAGGRIQIYLGLRRGPEVNDIVAGTVSVIAVFVIRIAALRYGWQTRAPRGFEGADTPDADQG